MKICKFINFVKGIHGYFHGYFRVKYIITQFTWTVKVDI